VIRRVWRSTKPSPFGASRPAARAQQLVDDVRRLGDAGITLDDVALRRPTLDEVFLTLTGRGSDEDEGDVAAGHASDEIEAELIEEQAA
jgi:ABC-2 type transport system ATP-binding protein